MADVTRMDPSIYRKLQYVARQMLAEKAPETSIDPTGLLHEAWIKLERSEMSKFEDRRHFFAVCARAMRQILIDRARAKSSLKRGERPLRIQLDFELHGERDQDLVEFDVALAKLRRLNPEAAEVGLLRVFGGLTVQEIADATGVTRRTATTRWKSAREFLQEQLKPIE